MNRLTPILAAVALIVASACSSDLGPGPKDATPEAPALDGDGKADRFGHDVEALGPIDYGDRRVVSVGAGAWGVLTVSAVEGARLVVAVEGDPGEGADPCSRRWAVDPLVAVEGHGLSEVADDVDWSGCDLDARLEAVAPATGTYRILVRDYAYRAGSFTVNLECSGDACAPTCRRNADCGDGEYCRTEGCDVDGQCAPVPDPTTVFCGTWVGEYCNCEGETRFATSTCIYEPVAHYGPCEETEPSCETNADCGAGEWCKAEGCDTPGTCEAIPDPGTLVCGAWAGQYCNCEGETRFASSTCIFERIAHYGPCETDEGCMDNGDCASGEWCQAAGCEGPGVCTPVPEPGTVLCGAWAGQYCSCAGETRSATSTCIYERVSHFGPCE